ncbi:hypothetical protein EHQ12_05535 [Leptospira gomenensis]|uniref:Uncharacterized protein n=1 Tax=Leptospira gomenensis TaxID=2484974 RepID=A0A5F1YAS2_9LEPT|nr:hypothetical protein [Leptospira gomenensis]TGK34503.1 hypothetical protein EHQ17_08740 [Leptospira gomenensis]TGK40187.1 hypothetical protein EHQ07_19160 [Leptospira gomenensis]TGK41888.1 hypothetical protein EHQ12_05535 [Leptospira gomenensis]TGK55696.1 hypothetical protein EHQ13_17385 [Leptospira gomenensis]
MEDITLAQIILEKIKKENENQQIPTNTDLYYHFRSTLNISEKKITKILNFLKDSNCIFVLNIKKQNPNFSVPGIDAYVVADSFLIDSLFSKFHKSLELQYNAMYRKSLTYQQILTRILDEIATIQNQTILELFTFCVLFEDIKKMIKTQPDRYEETERIKTLKELIRESETPLSFNPERKYNSPETVSISVIFEPDPPAAMEESLPDSTNKTKTKWELMAELYSIPFLLRIHFRKKEYSVIQQLLLSSKIKAAADLKMIAVSCSNLLSKNTLESHLRLELNNLRNLAMKRLLDEVKSPVFGDLELVI